MSILFKNKTKTKTQSLQKNKYQHVEQVYFDWLELFSDDCCWWGGISAMISSKSILSKSASNISSGISTSSLHYHFHQHDSQFQLGSIHQYRNLTKYYTILAVQSSFLSQFFYFSVLSVFWFLCSFCSFCLHKLLSFVVY